MSQSHKITSELKKIFLQKYCYNDIVVHKLISIILPIFSDQIINVVDKDVSNNLCNIFESVQLILIKTCSNIQKVCWNK